MKDYGEIKLGPIDRYKVWREKRTAEKDRAWRDKIEHETSEVDYSQAERLESDLLNKKRIKRATRDAIRLYKRDKRNEEKIGYDVLDGLGKEEFVQEYLKANGLKQRALPEPQKRHAFMDQYPTEKSEEEKKNQEKSMYYVIDGVRYKLPITVSTMYFEQMKRGKIDADNFPILISNDGINYTIDAKAMDPQRKNRVLEHITNCSILYIGELAYEFSDGNIETEPLKSYSKLGKKSNYVDYLVKKLNTDGKTDDANVKLEKMLREALEFNQEMLKDVQDREL